jgi:hypothetical protein
MIDGSVKGPAGENDGDVVGAACFEGGIDQHGGDTLQIGLRLMQQGLE